MPDYNKIIRGQKTINNMGDNMKKLITLLVVCLTFTLLSGCTKVADTVSSITNPEPTVVKSEDGVFQAEVPTGWEVAKKGELNKNAQLELSNTRDDSYFMALMEKKSDFNMDLEAYSKLVIDANAKAYNVPTSPERVKTTVGQYNSYLAQFTTSYNSVNFHMWIYAIETDNYYGQLFVWTKDSSSTDMQDELTKIVNSFKENK